MLAAGFGCTTPAAAKEGRREGRREGGRKGGREGGEAGGVQGVSGEVRSLPLAQTGMDGGGAGGWLQFVVRGVGRHGT